MDNIEEFKQLLQQIMSKDLLQLSDEELQQGIQEIEGSELLGDWVVWSN